MSYAVTDAVEDDCKKELRVLEDLIGQLDQDLACAHDCASIAPNVETSLQVAIYAAERAYYNIRHHYTCGHYGGDIHCPNCANIRLWRAYAERRL
jgi:hypothetical protein